MAELRRSSSVVRVGEEVLLLLLVKIAIDANASGGGWLFAAGEESAATSAPLSRLSPNVFASPATYVPFLSSSSHRSPFRKSYSPPDSQATKVQVKEEPSDIPSNPNCSQLRLVVVVERRSGDTKCTTEARFFKNVECSFDGGLSGVHLHH